MRSPVLSPNVVCIDDVIHIDTSYRVRPTRGQVHAYETRLRFGRKRPSASPRHVLDWEADAIRELTSCGFFMRGASFFVEEDSPEATGIRRRSICAERDGRRYVLFYDIK